MCVRVCWAVEEVLGGFFAHFGITFHYQTRGLKHPDVKLSNLGFHSIHVTVYFMFLCISFFQAGDGVGWDGSWERV